MRTSIQAAFSEIHAEQTLIDNTLAYLHSAAVQPRQQSWKAIISRQATALAALILLVIGLGAGNLYFSAAAYISIDVNPSLELTLNRFDRVINAHAFNTEGERMLQEAKLQGKGYEEATGLLMDALLQQGYLADDVLLSVTVQTRAGEKEQALCHSLQSRLNEELYSKQSAAELEIFPVTAELRADSSRCHMSPAKYLALQELLAVDESATPEQYADSSIHQIRQRAQECRQGHTHNADKGNLEEAPNQNQTEQGHSHGHGHGGGR